jgi:hypothetical protein
MELKICRDFGKWLENISISSHSSIKLTPTDFYNPGSLKLLRKRGFSMGTLTQAFGSIKAKASIGFACANEIRVLLYYWDNGDTICFPINSIGEVYIGSSEPFWWACFPFLQQQSPDVYRCHLPHHVVDSFSKPTLLLGAQEQFGHFLGDRVLPVKDVLHQHLSTHRQNERLYVCGPRLPQENTDLLQYIWPQKAKYEYITLPNASGIYHLRNVVVPSYEVLAEQALYRLTRLDNKTDLSCRKIALLGSSLRSRLVNYDALIEILNRKGYLIIEAPELLPLSVKSKLINSAQRVLLGIGSVAWNIIHSNSAAEVVLLFPSDLFATLEPSSTCMLHQFYLPLLTQDVSIVPLASSWTNTSNVVRSSYVLQDSYLHGIE